MQRRKRQIWSQELCWRIRVSLQNWGCKFACKESAGYGGCPVRTYCEEKEFSFWFKCKDFPCKMWGKWPFTQEKIIYTRLGVLYLNFLISHWQFFSNIYNYFKRRYLKEYKNLREGQSKRSSTNERLYMPYSSKTVFRIKESRAIFTSVYKMAR